MCGVQAASHVAAAAAYAELAGHTLQQQKATLKANFKTACVLSR